MTTNDIRKAFLAFFEKNGHKVVESAPLIPANDPTLLFTNAGMVPFKDCFLGTDKRSYTRATSSQRCVRAGGKHNDLENVGYTARHHTFFEMLGNFSFGDYSKKEAIGYCWELLTDVFKLPKEKLWVTVYAEDDEAYDIWAKDIGFPEDRISRIGDNKGERYASDNFWAMGDTGPCGPCSEVFYDHGEHIWGGPPGTPEEDGDRYIEIWNLVFMQYNRHKDGTMEPLPKPSVDTGMGLERISAILQGVHSNYEIDTFQYLIKQTADLLNVKDSDNKSLRVIADHIRSCCFLILDGIVPSNEGRGYVLRRITRRAIRHGHQLGAKGNFFSKLVQAMVDIMGEAYPALKEQQSIIEGVLAKEEDAFAKTLDKGMQILEADISDIKNKTISGETVFKLYDTYGFPQDLTADIAREKGLEIDWDGFEKAMEEQRQRARASSNFGVDYNDSLTLEEKSEFTGYDYLSQQVKVVKLLKDSEPVESLREGDKGIVILEKTPFYAESGGQVGDKGYLYGCGANFVVEDTQNIGDAIAHIGYVDKGDITNESELNANVDGGLRQSTMRNHSATHLLHAALREVLGSHVQQKGSLNDPDRLRFDFSNPEAVSREDLAIVERMVNEKIFENHSVEAAVMSMDEAKEQGAMALFGEKYGDEVRVLTMSPFSVELCGGTHVKRTGDIGPFKIVSETGIAAGVRRIEAITGERAVAWMQQSESKFHSLGKLLKSDPAQSVEKVEQLLDKSKQLEKQIQQLQSKLASNQGSDLASNAEEINGVKLLVSKLEGIEPKALRDMQDQLKNKLGSSIVVLGIAGDDKVSLIAGVSKDLTSKVKAGDLIKMVAEQVGGKGGGRPDMAQAGGKDPAALPAALESVKPWVLEKLS
ncbi:alanine--tRNA ligase [Kangiella geojedonensis]|uniref:Alanine--tRNA ligase n=1 Tax=Kangiella geojedonensis TaxID=914150 RepID=A0A0F6RC51_9GAMM|nr:alanine--tRNA ligase [Kangiella geojedonensis]AKE52118.1 alanyl-tRNA synthetase [Kangiella geojedonensis]